MAGMEPWKQCGQWLISCKVLPPNHRVTWDTAQVFDLAQTLRDGVLLCQLLNNLRGHSINLKEINLRPQMSQVRPGRVFFGCGGSIPASCSPPRSRWAGPGLCVLGALRAAGTGLGAAAPRGRPRGLPGTGGAEPGGPGSGRTESPRGALVRQQRCRVWVAGRASRPHGELLGLGTRGW